MQEDTLKLVPCLEEWRGKHPHKRIEFATAELRAGQGYDWLSPLEWCVFYGFEVSGHLRRFKVTINRELWDGCPVLLEPESKIEVHV